MESEGLGSSVDEFANVPSSGRRHPIVAIAAAGLAMFLLYQLHGNLLYALSHTRARDLGDARGVAAMPLDKLPINRYVRITGMADRESGVIIDTAGSWHFSQFFRLLGTHSRIFVSRVADPLPVEQAERDVFVGRLLRFRDLSYQAAIRKYFANRITATHFFAPTSVRDRVAVTGGGPVVLADMLGDKVSLAPNDEIAIDVARPAQVEVDLPRAKYPTAAAARAAVEQQGAKVLDQAGRGGDAKTLALVVTFPDGKRDQVMNAISNLDTRIRFLPVRVTHEVRVADLASDKDGLVLKSRAAAPQVLPLDRILDVRTQAAVQIPDDALLLREGERPSDCYKDLVVAIFLLAFAAINLLALRVRV